MARALCNGALIILPITSPSQFQVPILVFLMPYLLCQMEARWQPLGLAFRNNSYSALYSENQNTSLCRFDGKGTLQRSANYTSDYQPLSVSGAYSGIPNAISFVPD